MTVYTLPDIIEQVSEAQVKVAWIERYREHQSKCNSCRNLIEDTKIILDGVHTNLVDLVEILKIIGANDENDTGSW